MDGLGAATEDGGVAGLEAEGGGVCSDVGAALVDDADGADGDADLTDFDAAGLLPRVHDMPGGIREGGDVLDGAGNGFDASWIEAEAIEQGGGEFFVLSGGDVLGVFGEDFPGVIAEAEGHCAEDLILGFGAEEGEVEGGGAGLAAHVVNGFGDVFRHWRRMLGKGEDGGEILWRCRYRR